MKVARLSHGGNPASGIVIEDRIFHAGGVRFDPEPAGGPIPLSDVDLLSPIEPTAKIICAGLNYVDHAEETGAVAPDEPLIFAKLPNSLIGPHESIVIPDLTNEVDFEAELGAVIGRRARNIDPSEAKAHVFGYTCVNDVSARDLQLATGSGREGNHWTPSVLWGPGW